MEQIIENNNSIKKNILSPVFKSVNGKSSQLISSQSHYSESSDCDIPSIQINQSIKSGPSSKCKNNEVGFASPFSPIYSPIPVLKQFRPPSIHTLGSVIKKHNSQIFPDKRSIGKKYDVSLKSGEIQKDHNAFDGLKMTDIDISWVSSMASPPAKAVSPNIFNTIEKATFFPEEKFQRFQGRALFSPTSDQNFGCSPLSFSSDSEEDTCKTKARLSDVCASLRELEFKSQGSPLNSFEDKEDIHGKTFSNDMTIYNPKSPVFIIKPRKPVLLKKKDVVVRSPENTITCQPVSNEDENENKCEERSHFDEKCTFGGDSIDEETKIFSKISMLEIQKMCNTLINSKKKKNFPQNLINVLLSSNQEIIHIEYIKYKNPVPKHFYTRQVYGNIEQTGIYFSSYDELHNLTFNDDHINTELKRKINKSFINRDLWNKVKKYLESNIKLSQSNMEKQSSLESSKTPHLYSISNCFAELENGSTINEDIIHIVEMLELEEKMLEAAEEAENNLSEEKEMMKAVKKAESTMNFFEDKKVSEQKICKSIFNEEIMNVLTSNNIKSNLGTLLRFKMPESIWDEHLTPSYNTNMVKVNNKLISENHQVQAFNANCMINFKNTKNIEINNLLNEDIPDFEYPCFLGFHESNNLTVPSFKLKKFTTCLGKEVEVTKEALSRAQVLKAEQIAEHSVRYKENAILELPPECEKLIFTSKMSDSFKDYLDESSKNETSVNHNDFMSFCDSNYGLNSPKSFDKEYKQKIEDLNLSRISTTEFTTCLGKKVEISEDALKKGQALLLNCNRNLEVSESHEIDDSLYNCVSEHKGFSTASGLSITASSKSLKKANELLSKCDDKKFFGKLDGIKIRDFINSSDPRMREVPPNSFAENKNELSVSIKKFSGYSENTKIYLNKKTEFENKVLLQPNLIVPNDEKNFGLVTDKLTNDVRLEIHKSFYNNFISNFKESPCKNSIKYMSLRSQCERKRQLKKAMVSLPWSFDNDTHGRKFSTFHDDIHKNSFGLQNEKTAETIKQKNTNISDSKRSGIKRSIPNTSVSSKRMKRHDEALPSDRCHTYLNIKEKRTELRMKQEAIIKQKHDVKPIVGSHLLKKLTIKQSKFVRGNEDSFLHNHYNELTYINISRAENFKFHIKDFYKSCFDIVSIELGDKFKVIPSDENILGVKEFKAAFLAGEGVDPNLIPRGWIENHYKWIIWKLYHYDKILPAYIHQKFLTPQNVMLQLKYRYDREIDRHERSALKKILEKDDISTKRMVLCICEIKQMKLEGTAGYELILTDGWYSCPARTDYAMVKFIEKGKVSVGTKLIIQGAILVNCDQGTSPLEVTEDVHLKIFTNSTRRITGYAKLGFQKNPGNIQISLGSVLPEGGFISRIDVLVVRVYPLLYLEKITDGRRIIRNKRSEEKVDSEYRKNIEQKLETIYNEVQNEIQETDTDSFLPNVEHNVCGLIKSISDSRQYIDMKNFSKIHQIETTENYRVQKLQDQFMQKILGKLEDKLKIEKLNRRNVTEFLKVKIVDLQKPNYKKPVVLSIWSPSEETIGLISEGTAMSVTNVNISNFYKGNNFIKINTTKQTMFKKLKPICEYPARCLTSLSDISAELSPFFEEVDLVGIIIKVTEDNNLLDTCHIIYLSDSDMNFVGLSFQHHYKDYIGALSRGSIVACCNLCWMAGKRVQNKIPILQAKETTIFTENPKYHHTKKGLEILKQNLPKELNSFILACEKKLNNTLENLEFQNTCKKSLNKNIYLEKTQAKTCMSGEAATNNVVQPMNLNAKTTECISISKAKDKLLKDGKSSHSPFRWLPYKNV